MTIWSFSSGSMPAGAALTRASQGAYRNSSGIVQFASTNVARFDFNPSTLALRGLLLEGQKTNFKANGNNFSAWGNAPPTHSTVTGPDGISNSAVETGGGFYNDNSNNFPADNLVIIESVFVHSPSSGLQFLQIPFNPGDVPGNVYCNFDIINGTVQGNSGIVSAGVEAYPNGWFRVWVAAQCGLTNNEAAFYLWPINSGTDGFAPGQSSLDFDIYGAMTEVRATGQTFPSSPILVPTGTSVTRAADALTITLGAGATQITVTFDDGSTQVISGLSGGSYTLDPTVLNRPWIKQIQDGASGGGPTGVGTVSVSVSVSGVATGFTGYGSGAYGSGPYGTQPATGIVSGIATASAVAKSLFRSSGSIAGVASAPGVAQPLSPTGKASGVATATAAGASSAVSAGAAAASVSVVGASQPISRAVGAAMGSATAQGLADGFAVGTAISSGSASVSAIGFALGWQPISPVFDSWTPISSASGWTTIH